MPKQELILQNERLLRSILEGKIDVALELIGNGADLTHNDYICIHTAITNDQHPMIEELSKLLDRDESGINEHIAKYLSRKLSAPECNESPRVVVADVSGAGGSVARDHTISLSSKKKKKKLRCAADGCRYSNELMMQECRCMEKFCSKHLFYLEHNCLYDYKEQGRKKLAEDNPVVVADKIENRI
ncbi:MAG: AN1-type zinc finger domain-containing protein [Francisellaceae bacterium]|jgi:hypothetical protein|nr:AN1-type zinc finger domain-containing protein [Francisellaceae bacterium]MBT6206926.1 AN1-type zinc finger domain-containing protein [Francisellaceae bacterium]MBT6538497.1 AN1-type zinc finger domain-containing protein [Francisellaceae bacterium]